jgi:penicillin-binding protein 1C
MKTLRRLFLIAAAAAALLAAGAYLFIELLPYSADRLSAWPTSPVLLDRKGGVFAVFLSEDSEWSIPVPLSRMGRWLPMVAMEVEDRRFREHGGVDWASILRASWQNASAGRVVSGASTITSQLVRLSNPRARTIKTKLLEFAAAIQTEKHFSKDEILELYLNRAPLGGNIRGVEAAARIYFSKSASEVSLAEAALLVGMLKGPTVYRPDRNPERALARRNAILADLASRGVITEERRKMAEAEQLPPGRGELPAKARHFALAALGDRQEGGEIRTTLDPAIQAALERSLAASLDSMPREVTASGVVMENEGGEILAYVGNARLGSGLPGSWVDCGRSPRSPGSALKPFAYLAAFERGLITPASLLADTPLAFLGNAPRNFDLIYRGPVTARTALADSLNVPAVRVLRTAGQEYVMDLLRNCGFRSLTKPAGHYGDSLILGGCEVTLLQMAEGYGVLANLGIRRVPWFLASDAPPGRRIVREGASFLTADILKDTGRLLPVHRARIEGKKDWFAFKTGTSYGYRDAWTAAYNPRYTVIVWMGDPKGSPHPELVGLSAAAPAVVELLRALPRGGWYDTPEEVLTREVCSLSGSPPSPACLSTRKDYWIEGTSSSAPCSMHVIRDGKKTVLWPAELEEFARRRSLEVEAGSEISIVSPLPGSRYFVTPFGGEQKTALRAEGAVPPVYWFIGGAFAGKQEGRDHIFRPLKKGRHTISLVDSRGKTASSWVIVEGIEKEPEHSPGPSPLIITPGD